MDLEIPMVNLKREHVEILEEAKSVVTEVLKNSDFIRGGKVFEFERCLAEYLGVPYVITCASGTDAIKIGLLALSLPPDAEVIVPAFTYIATMEPAILLRFKVKIVDIEENYFSIDTEKLQEAISENTKVIIPVDLFGQCANMGYIVSMAKSKNIYVIEDCAQALGSEYIFTNGERKKAGTLGDIGCTSFFPTKNLGGCGDGGAIFTENPILAERAYMIANHGQKQVKYVHYVPGLNSRLDTIQAALLLIKFKHFFKKIIQKQEIARMYEYYLKDVEEIILPKVAPWSTHTYHLFTIRVPKYRDELQKFLLSKGIGCNVYYPIPLNKQEVYVKIYGEVSCPVAEKVSREVISLPMNPYLTEKEVSKISNTIKDFFAVIKGI